MNSKHRPIPIYTTSGEAGAFLVYPYIFDPLGDWIGWVTPERLVYSVHGKYIGWLSDDPRILKKRSDERSHPNRKPPPPPGAFKAPATVPLAPLMAELPYSVMDVLEESPDLLPTPDSFAFENDVD